MFPGARFSLFLLCLSAALSPAGAADTNGFLARVYTNAAGATLPYRLLPPRHVDPARAYPVVLYLHGAAARGDDNLAPLDWGPLLFRDGPARAGHDFYLVIPQCPSGVGWVSAAARAGRAAGADPLGLSVALVTEVLPRELRLDPKRRYLTGVSMGGYGTWAALGRYPGLFAAAVPVCAPGERDAAIAAAVQCPVWVFHSDDDHLVSVRQARDMVEAWKAKGGVAKYTEYQGLKHSSWKKAYVDEDLFRWLFAQTLP
jgi:predicted peptidase